MPWEGQRRAPQSPHGQEETPGKLEPVTDAEIRRGTQTARWATRGTADPSSQTGSPRKGKLESPELWLRPQGRGGGQGGARDRATCCSDSRKLAVSAGHEPEAQGPSGNHTHSQKRQSACAHGLGNRPGIVKTRVYAAQPWAGWPRQAEEAGGWREEISLVIGGGHASAVGRDSGVKVTVGGTTQLAGDAQQGCCTPREEAGPPRKGYVRGTAGKAEDDCDAHGHLGTDGTGACGARPGCDGGQEGDTGPVGRTLISPPEPMQCGCWREMGRPPVLAKSSLKQHHTR